MTDEEKKLLREYRAQLARTWWAKMTPEQRREKRRQYMLQSAKNKQNRKAGNGETND